MCHDCPQAVLTKALTDASICGFSLHSAADTHKITVAEYSGNNRPFRGEYVYEDYGRKDAQVFW